MKLSQFLRAGVVAGLASGLAGAAALWLLVEPFVKKAIALEEAHAVHGHSEELVSRNEQVVAGLVTVLIVGALLGLIFAIVYHWTYRHLPGASHFGKSVALAGLGFLAFALAPALVIPANPPGIGDPTTVTGRTLVYVATIGLAIVLIAAASSISRAAWPLPARGVGIALLGVAGIAGLMTLLPNYRLAAPDGFPAELLWKFRIASLAQLGLMWLVRGLAFGWLMESTASRESEQVPADKIFALR